MMTISEKVDWLQENYGKYSRNWYLEDINRLNAIFNREFSNRERKNSILAEQIARLDELGKSMRVAYQAVYHANYDSDFKVSRRETHDRVMAIRHLWVTNAVGT